MQPERGVENNIIFSADMPRIRIRVSDTFEYVGRLDYILSNVAHVTSFHFVEADAQKRIQRSFMVQFEGYLPDNTYSYNYPSQERVRLGDHEYIYDVMAADMVAAAESRPGSDMEHNQQLLIEKGYQIDILRTAVRERYVRLLGDAQRDEILFIYTEDLSRLGHKAEGYQTLGDDYLPEVKAALHTRGMQSFSVIEG